MDAVSYRGSSGQFDPIHYAGNVASPEFTDGRGANFREDQTLPDGFILVGGSVLQVTASSGEERFGEVSEGSPLASRCGLSCAFVCDGIGSLPSRADMSYGLFPGLLWRQGRIFTEDNSATLGEAAPPHPELNHEGRLPAAPPMGSESP